MQSTLGPLYGPTVVTTRHLLFVKRKGVDENENGNICKIDVDKYFYGGWLAKQRFEAIVFVKQIEKEKKASMKHVRLTVNNK
jgi:hypothetical protein